MIGSTDSWHHNWKARSFGSRSSVRHFILNRRVVGFRRRANPSVQIESSMRMKKQFVPRNEVWMNFENKLSLPGHILNVYPGHCIIIKPILWHHALLQIKADDEVVITGFDPAAFSLQTRVIDKTLRPLLLFADLASCQSLEVKERRETERYRVLLGASCSDLVRDLSWECHIINISKSGCLGLGSRSLLEGSKLSLTISPGWFGRIIQARVQVVRNGATDSGIETGFKYVHFPGRGRLQLNNYIDFVKNRERLQHILVTATSKESQCCI
jgi:hypothetical protein